jgi:hypothetical protein
LNLRRKLIRYGKKFWLGVRPLPSEHRIFFILGCQRSGTTLLLRIFEEDWNAQVYREVSALSRQAGLRRLQPPEVVARPLIAVALHAPHAWSGRFVAYYDPEVQQLLRET